MPESRSHKRLKSRNARNGGRTEVKLHSGRRLDAVTRNKVGTEVERNGKRRLPAAVSRLREAEKSKLTKGSKLIVPDKDMQAAGKEMRRQGQSGRVQNLSNTKSFYVKKTRKVR